MFYQIRSGTSVFSFCSTHLLFDSYCGFGWVGLGSSTWGGVNWPYALRAARPTNQQCQSTEGKSCIDANKRKYIHLLHPSLIVNWQMTERTLNLSTSATSSMFYICTENVTLGPLPYGLLSTGTEGKSCTGIIVLKQPQTEYKHSLTFHVRLCCHSNKTCAPIANPSSSAQIEGIPYNSPKLHSGPCSNVGMWQRSDRHTDRNAHRRAWPIYILHHLRLTRNVSSSMSYVLLV